jgi:hypothetical protein
VNPDLAAEPGHIAGDTVIPLAYLVRREANHQTPPAVPVRRQGESPVPWRSKLHSQIDCLVRLGMLRRRRFVQLEDQFAKGISGGVIARR